MEAEPTQKRKVKIVAISDTHDKHRNIDPASWPQADIFIHAGDFTRVSRAKEFERFRQFLESLPYKHKIVIPGNHDFGLDTPERYQRIRQNWGVKEKEKVVPDVEAQKIKKLCTYLCHEYVEVEGVRIFGSPYVLADYDMGFTYKHEEADKIWSGLPTQLDILVTHSPPYGILDAIAKPVFPGPSVGCKRLLQSVQLIQPKAHIFGHIHESHGNIKVGNTHFYNVAYLDQTYIPQHSATIIQIEVDSIKQ